MLVLLNARKYLLISLLIIFIDGFIVYFIPEYFNKINYLYPMLTISFLPFIYIINKKSYYILIIIIGIIYDLLYSSIFLYNVILFMVLVSIDIQIMKYYKKSLLLMIIITIINIIMYDSISFLLIILTNYQQVTFHDLIYKVDHSIILNIMSVFVYWFLFKKDIYHA